MLDRILIGSSVEPSDPNFKNVTLLLHGDGSNGAQNNTFLDSSTNNFTITRNGNTTQGSFSPYGSNWSNYFDGSTGYITVAHNSALDVWDSGSGSFTVEAWIYATASIGNNISIVGKAPNNGSPSWSPGWAFQVYNGYLNVNTPSDTRLFNSNTTSVPLNQWVHCVLVKSGSTVSIYQNGVRVGTTTNSTAYSNTLDVVSIGIDRNFAGGKFPGYISNVRMVKGTAVYDPSQSSLTVPTTPLTAITNTSLLTCQSNRFRDASTNNFTITRNGDVRVTNFAPFAPSSAYSTSTNGGSAYFDGSGDYLTSSSSSALGFGTGDFTIELWFYTPAFTAIQALIDLRSGAVAEPLALSVSSSGLARSYDLTVRTGGQCNANQWNHIAWVRASNVNTVYVNGVVGHSWTNGADYGSSRPSWIGMSAGGGSEPFTGYISNLRVVKGSAVYTAAFTPPTSPVTAITNTQLLLNATNAAIFDNSMKNDLETAGNAQISTSVKKFGTGSMAFDGSGDWLGLPSAPQLYFGTSDFTAEAWIYPTGGSGNRAVFTGSVTNGFAFYINSSGKIAVAKSSVAEIIASTTTISTSGFTHVAATRSGNTFRIFVNGTLEATVTSSQDFTAFNDNRIGYENGSSYYVGYIDELRITSGVARYTATFTAPTAPFPNK